MIAITAGVWNFQDLWAGFTKRKPDRSAKAPLVIVDKPDLTNIEVTPEEGPNHFQFLDVKNLGKEAVFQAEAQIISSQNSNSFLMGVYPLGWGDDRDGWVVIPRGTTRKILVATIKEVYPGSLFHMALIQAGPSEERHWARWNVEDHAPLPRFGLKVSIIAKGANQPWIGYFSVAPNNEDGTGWRLRTAFRGVGSIAPPR